MNGPNLNHEYLLKLFILFIHTMEYNNNKNNKWKSTTTKPVQVNFDDFSVFVRKQLKSRRMYITHAACVNFRFVNFGYDPNGKILPSYSVYMYRMDGIWFISQKWAMNTKEIFPLRCRINSNKIRSRKYRVDFRIYCFEEKWVVFAFFFRCSYYSPYNRWRERRKTPYET